MSLYAPYHTLALYRLLRLFNAKPHRHVDRSDGEVSFSIAGRVQKHLMPMPTSQGR